MQNGSLAASRVEAAGNKDDHGKDKKDDKKKDDKKDYDKKDGNKKKDDKKDYDKDKKDGKKCICIIICKPKDKHGDYKYWWND